MEESCSSSSRSVRAERATAVWDIASCVRPARAKPVPKSSDAWANAASPEILRMERSRAMDPATSPDSRRKFPRSASISLRQPRSRMRATASSMTCSAPSASPRDLKRAEARRRADAGALSVRLGQSALRRQESVPLRDCARGSQGSLRGSRPHRRSATPPIPSDRGVRLAHSSRSGKSAWQRPPSWCRGGHRPDRRVGRADGDAEGVVAVDLFRVKLPAASANDRLRRMRRMEGRRARTTSP